MRERKVLSLNSDYLPVALRTWQDTMCLVYKGAARPVEYYEDFFVHSAYTEHQVPSVIVNNAWISFRPRIEFSKAAVMKRDDYTCMYCGKGFRHEYRKLLTVDHVLPRSRGGKNTFENLVAACHKCNNKKSNKTPEEARMPLLRRPIAPSHNEAVRFHLLKNNNIEPEWERWLKPYL